MKAKRIKITPPPPPPDEVQLTFSLEEAELLKKFSGQVAGEDIKGTGHKFFDLFRNIFSVLHGEGVDSATTNFQVTSVGSLNNLRIGDR